MPWGVAQPVHCHWAYQAEHANSRPPKIPTIAATAHGQRPVKRAMTTNSGNDTMLNRAIEVNPAGPPHRVRYGRAHSMAENSVMPRLIPMNQEPTISAM